MQDLARDQDGGGKELGLFRSGFGGPEGTVAAVFGHFADHPGRFSLMADPRWGIWHVRIDLPEAEGRGYWRFISLAGGVFAVITNCHYAKPRRERVPAEGLVELHYLLEGPVELTLPEPAEGAVPTQAMLLACQQAEGLAYEVVCQAAPFRMVSLYVRPDVLQESFGFSGQRGSVGHQLLCPAPGTIAMSEQKIGTDALMVLRGLLGIGFGDRRDLVLAASHILRLLTETSAVFDRRSRAQGDAMVLTARELAMFERARDILSTNFSGSLTIPRLARTLGTNSTKLKSGFKLLYGTTTFQFRNDRRMERAMHLLVEEKLPIAEVADAVGFRHQASFATAFRTHFGFTPKQARKLIAS